MKEKLKNPIIPKEQIKLVLLNYRKVDFNKMEGKQKLVNAFINAIYVYDDTIKIIFNGTNKEDTISIEEIDCSKLNSDSSPNENKLNSLGLTFFCKRMVGIIFTMEDYDNFNE